jgi:hypothetical protein
MSDLETFVQKLQTEKSMLMAARHHSQLGKMLGFYLPKSKEKYDDLCPNFNFFGQCVRVNRHSGTCSFVNYH